MKRALLFCLALTACGYHLVGSADDGRPTALPAGTNAVALLAPVDVAPFFRLRLRQAGIEIAAQAEVALRVLGPSFSFVPASFDASGAPRQYRLHASGRVVVEQRGKAVWQSGEITVEDWIFAQGDPGALETARRAHEQMLKEKWLAAAWAKVRSGW